MGVGGQRHAPAALPPVMTRYPLYMKLGRPQGRSGRMLKISPQPGFDPRTVKLVASRYTDWAIAAHSTIKEVWNIWKSTISFLWDIWERPIKILWEMGNSPIQVVCDTQNIPIKFFCDIWNGPVKVLCKLGFTTDG
jgi:hypothetical protein